jgi:hypothetical protein
MVVDQAPRAAAEPGANGKPGDRADAGPPRLPPPPPAPRFPKATSAAAAPPAGVSPIKPPTPSYAVATNPVPAGHGHARAPRVIAIEPGVAPAYAILRPDPAWKRCQIGPNAGGEGAYFCGPYSYHPYGAHGYRPYGSYRAYRSAPGYVLAPSAKIISIDSD